MHSPTTKILSTMQKKQGQPTLGLPLHAEQYKRPQQSEYKQAAQMQ